MLSAQEQNRTTAAGTLRARADWPLWRCACSQCPGQTVPSCLPWTFAMVESTWLKRVITEGCRVRRTFLPTRWQVYTPVTGRCFHICSTWLASESGCVRSLWLLLPLLHMRVSPYRGEKKALNAPELGLWTVRGWHGWCWETNPARLLEKLCVPLSFQPASPSSCVFWVSQLVASPSHRLFSCRPHCRWKLL